jgi:hypothetical protein
MKAYLVKTGTLIEPFGDDVGQAFIGGQGLAEATGSALRGADVEIEFADSSSDLPLSGDYLILPDSLFLTRRGVREFLGATAGSREISRLALLRSAATDYAASWQGTNEKDEAVTYDLYRFRGTQMPRDLSWPELKSFLTARAHPLTLDPTPQMEHLPQSRPGPSWTTRELPRTTLLAAEVHHWTHIVWLNHLLPWVRLEEHWEDRPGLKRSLRSRGRNPYRRAIRRSVIGQGCDIHPTAHVEGSILGDKVKLGPFSSVRDSIIGAGVEIADLTKFKRCVVGEGCHTLNDSYFIGCTFYPGSTLASFMLRNSVLGRRVFITSGVMFWDEAIEEPVKVKQAGEEIDTGRWLLGGCAGHECVLGTRAIFLPGRAVPNRTMIVMRPEEGVVKLPQSAEKLVPHVYHQGRIRKIADVLPGYEPQEIEP